MTPDERTTALGLFNYARSYRASADHLLLAKLKVPHPHAPLTGGVQAIIPRQEACRNAVCALEAYLAARPVAIARAMRCPVRVHVGSDCAEPSQACQIGRAATAVRPFARCVSVASVSKVERKSPAQSSGWQSMVSKNAPAVPRRRYADFCNKIGTFETCRQPLGMSVYRGRPEVIGARSK
jgi:hypothetical protein